ncbi:protein FAR1-related sequence 11 [Tanacetum coccineum]
MRFLPANCIITPEDEQEIMLYKEAGLNVQEIIRVMELKKNVKHGGLSFLDKDIHNLFTKVFLHKDCFKMPPVYSPLRWCSDNLQRSAKDNEISMDETSINNEDILLDNMPDADNDILYPPKSIPKGCLRLRLSI